MKDFESRLERLEDLAEKIRQPELPLEEAVKVFEEGVRLAKTLKKELEKIQAKVEILTSDPDTNANASSLPFNPGEEN
ncbi:MAG: exodeoxyribonuclease VII small subunit [Spirochaetia bacterium]|jgi:exodeoxyribonuclease VII small subunit|uniref:Exodeoxyribonuclease 7 small subunit n=2 Tax=root TaxID=1 RepID=A0A652ZYL6_9SPIR|nr:exodeoxyribonuclease VII small subunit [Spirochaetia bacterium]MDD3820101.1 exodeoxyribonuclease VII small subunit [Spirochaetales bacterium]NLX45738.1 exodeoxyribonuclease VII small subunit [Treponema sp.]VBB40880.1 Exodeoxyribonuclease 7 small subunit [uncultured Spirochaetota bacterium]MCE1208139.1 exodeoxyribonuclease VII small subunit [Spirochaetia bacterium]